MTHIDPLNPTGLNEMFAVQTRVRPKNHVLVAGARCHLLANMIELLMQDG